MIINKLNEDNICTEMVEKFECLDHSYLKNEVEKLLYKLRFVQTKMEKICNKYDDF